MRPNQSPITTRRKGAPPFCANPAFSTQPEVPDLSDARLGFRPFTAVKRHRGDLLRTDYLAAPPLGSSSPVTDYLAALQTLYLDSRPLVLHRVVRAATGTTFFNALPSPDGHSFQQPTADKATSPRRRYQQNFSFTPSESILTFSPPQSVINNAPDAVGARALVEVTSAREVRR